MAYKTLINALLVAGLAFSSAGMAAPAAAPAAAPEAPPPTLSGASAEMLSNTCAGCHGTNGASSGPASPTIAGISKAYFVEVMKGFKGEGEELVPSTIMGRIVKGYTDAEIEAMAGYFAAKPFVAGSQKFDATLASKGAKLHDKYCEKCHAEGGTSAEDDSGILSGQWAPYLSWSMADFQDGKRHAPKKMAKKVDELMSKEGAEGMKALINYYASAGKK